MKPVNQPVNQKNAFLILLGYNLYRFTGFTGYLYSKGIRWCIWGYVKVLYKKKRVKPVKPVRLIDYQVIIK